MYAIGLKVLGSERVFAIVRIAGKIEWPQSAYIEVPLEGFRWQVGEQEGTEPAFYLSSQGVKRFFCNQCGTPMAFQAEHYPGEIHLYAATLENAQDFKPTFHVHYREKL